MYLVVALWSSLKSTNTNNTTQVVQNDSGRVGGLNLNGFKWSHSFLASKEYFGLAINLSMWFCCTLPSEWERLLAVFVIRKVTFIVWVFYETYRHTILKHYVYQFFIHFYLFFCSHSNTNCSNFSGFAVPALWNLGWTRQPQPVWNSYARIIIRSTATTL